MFKAFTQRISHERRANIQVHQMHDPDSRRNIYYYNINIRVQYIIGKYIEFVGVTLSTTKKEISSPKSELTNLRITLDISCVFLIPSPMTLLSRHGASTEP